VKKGTISIYYTRTEDQIADILTKPLPEASFTKFREKIMEWKTNQKKPNTPECITNIILK
jgi:hypothetical protein